MVGRSYPRFQEHQSLDCESGWSPRDRTAEKVLCACKPLPKGAREQRYGRRCTINEEPADLLQNPGQESHFAKPPKEREGDRCAPGSGVMNFDQGVGFPIMRPKKVILVVDDNEQDLSVLKFMLETNGYRVVSGSTGQEAISVFAEIQVDLVLADYAMPQMNGNQLVSRLKQMAPHVPMILLGDPQKTAGEIHAADALLGKKTCTSQELLERIKVMSARKRGPRKGTQRMTPVTELAAAS